MGPAFGRTWTRASDKKQITAAFAGLEDGKILLKLPNGKTVPAPMEMFTKADQEAAQRFAILGDDIQVKKAAKTLDGLLAKKLAAADFTGFNEPIPDDLFVRRVYLDIIGRIPTREEFLKFAESPRADKREALIDELLTHPGYASHMFNYFADMYRLHGDADFPNGVHFEPYIQYWKESLANNVHYDEMVRQMITATGNMGHNPASGFILRDAGMEFDAFSNFGQVMLGIDISCAQCHDHPFDDWTMDDFYEMAAFFGSTQRTFTTFRAAGAMMMGGEAGEMPNAPEKWKWNFEQYASSQGINLRDQQQARQFRYYLNFLGWNLADLDDAEMPVPMNVEDIGGEVFRPKTMVGKPAKMSGRTRREAMAEWLTGPENPRFALVIANRMWSRAFGRALVEPVHDFPVEWERETAQPDVAKYAASVMKGLNYDLRQFMRTLYNTRAYQSIATYDEPSQARSYTFQGPILRRLRAEQAWDSLMLLAHGPEIDTVRGRDGSFLRSLLNVDFNNESMADIFARYESWKNNYRRLGSGIVDEPGQLDPRLPDVPRMGNLELIRASEMVQPAPGASLLDTFGQSDRLVTDEHTYDGSVPQVLALMNGSITNRLTGSGSKVVEDLEDLDAPEDKVRAVYFTMLSRFPTDDEQSMGVDILDEYGDDGIRDLAWALMNSPEFLFIQ
ncbi:MAG: DUF1549 domain-containing protein [Verrucomicrobiota bacterium]